MKRWLWLVILSLPLGFLLGAANASRNAGTKTSRAAFPPSLQFHANYAQLPLAFEPNQGQVESPVQFLARGQGYKLFLTADEAVLSLKKFSSRPARLQQTRKASPLPAADHTPPTVLRLKLLNARESAVFKPLEQLPGVSHYLIGNDPTQWHRNIPQYAKVQAEEIYPGVDMVYYGNQGKLEYDFRLKPGADSQAIRLKLEGADQVEITADGKLKITAGGRTISFLAPTAYQEETDGSHTTVSGKYVLTDTQEIRFEIDSYDKNKTLVIDPALDYSTYLGGSNIDETYGLAVDSSGNAYVAGFSESANFPTTGGAYQTTFGGKENAFISKLNAAGSALVYSTYLGGTAQGTNSDSASGIAVDSNGEAVVAGKTTSTNFPTTSGAYQTTMTGIGNAFVAKLSANGSTLLYSTYLGGNGALREDAANAVALDAGGNIYVTGFTGATNFPTTNNAYQTADPYPANCHVFVSKINPGGNGTADLLASTYLGGNALGASPGEEGMGIAVDNAGNIYVCGASTATNFPTTAGAYQTTSPANANNHCVISELSGNAVTLLYSSYLDGTDAEIPSALVLDSGNHVYLTGTSSSTNFPTTAGAFQTTETNQGNSFVSKLNLGGNGSADLLYSTYLGGNNPSLGNGIALDANDNVYVAGYTNATNFPTTAGAYESTYTATVFEAFLTKLNLGGNGAGDLIYSTYLGAPNTASAVGVALDPSGNVYVAGITNSQTFPTTAGAYQTTLTTGAYNAFITKFDAVDFGNPTVTFTNTPTNTATRTATNTVTNTQTPTLTNTPTSTVTHTATITATNTPSATFTVTPTLTITATPTSTATRTITPIPPATATATLTPTNASVAGGCIGSPIVCYSYPNPATGGTMSLMCELCETSSVNVAVYNVAAERVAAYSYSGSNGINTYSLDISGFAHGVYLLMVQSSGPSGSRQSNLQKFAIVR